MDLFPRVFHVLSSLYASRSTHSVIVDCNTANARTFLPMLGDACKCELRSRDRCHRRRQIDLYHESICLSEEGTKGKCPKTRLEEKTALHELGYDTTIQPTSRVQPCAELLALGPVFLLSN